MTPKVLPKASVFRRMSWMSCSSASEEVMPKANMEANIYPRVMIAS